MHQYKLFLGSEGTAGKIWNVTRVREKSRQSGVRICHARIRVCLCKRNPLRRLNASTVNECRLGTMLSCVIFFAPTFRPRSDPLEVQVGRGGSSRSLVLAGVHYFLWVI